ncbi:hypothetical protein FOA52_014462 [Chlamydomonas sp. UWO 241]|nr:hypothetical protein FOA52_014462 [Chlamydomonas sp. UWO 241]
MSSHQERPPDPDGGVAGDDDVMVVEHAGEPAGDPDGEPAGGAAAGHPQMQAWSATLPSAQMAGAQLPSPQQPWLGYLAQRLDQLLGSVGPSGSRARSPRAANPPPPALMRGRGRGRGARAWDLADVVEVAGGGHGGGRAGGAAAGGAGSSVGGATGEEEEETAEEEGEKNGHTSEVEGSGDEDGMQAAFDRLGI